AASGRRRARDEAGRGRRAARELARLDQSGERQPDGRRHDGRRVRRMKAKPVRRIVTDDDEQGKSRAIHDGPSPDVLTDPARPGFSSTRIWVTDRTPARIKGVRETVHLPHAIEPPAGGSVCRILSFPPDGAFRGGAKEVRAFFEAMGSP